MESKFKFSNGHPLISSYVFVPVSLIRDGHQSMLKSAVQNCPNPSGHTMREEVHRIGGIMESPLTTSILMIFLLIISIKVPLKNNGVVLSEVLISF